MRSRPATFVAQCPQRCARTFRRGMRAAFSFCQIALGFMPCLCRSLSATGRGQFHSGASSFGKSDRDGLFCGARAVFAFTDVMHFLAHEFSRLSGGRLSSPLVGAGAFDGLLFWHNFFC